QSHTARLTCYAHERDKVIGCRAGNAAFGHATVTVAKEHAAFVVHSDFVEVEKVAVLMAATLLPDASHALNWVIRCGIHCRPGRAAIVGDSDECVPSAGETHRLLVACYVCPGESQ